jgi:hypothetical protein
MDGELTIGGRDPELLEEDARQIVVVVLARVHEQFLMAFAQGQRHSGCLHELRTIADDGYDLHGMTLATGLAGGA